MRATESIPFVASLFLLVATLERIPRIRLKALPLWRPYLATDAIWYLVATAVNLTAALLVLPALARLSPVAVSTRVAEWPFPARFVFAIVAYDFLAFAIHVGLHRSQALWAVHKVHHSSLELDWLATTRAHMAENLIRQVGALAPLVFLGVPPKTVAAALVVYAAFAVYGHSNLRSGPRWIEAVFVTPRVHRVHHIPATSQRNFATIFTVWDQLFSRYLQAEDDRTSRLGVPGEIDSYPQTLLRAFYQPFRENLLRRRLLRAPLPLASDS